MNYEQPPTEEELQVRAAYGFRMHHRDTVIYLDTIQEYTAESLITEGREKLRKKLAKLRRSFKNNPEALDVLADL